MSFPMKAVVLSAIAAACMTTAAAQFQAHGTYFHGMGVPIGGCGVSPGLAKDDHGKPLPYVALNTNSEFSNGVNCGRWVEITVKENCEGSGNGQWSPCNGGQYMPDSFTNDIIYGYVMDSCPDENFWCQMDTYHLDMSNDYLNSVGLTNDRFNGRKISWRYIDHAPTGWSMSRPKFAFKDGSKWTPDGTFWATVVIYNVSNGIGGVEQKMAGGNWQSISPLTHLGNMWVLARPENAKNGSGGHGQTVQLRVKDVNGNSYGDFEMKWMCGGEACGSYAPADSWGM